MPTLPRLSLFALLPPLLLTACGGEQAPESNVIRPVRAIQVAVAGMLADRSFPGRAKATQG